MTSRRFPLPRSLGWPLAGLVLAITLGVSSSGDAACGDAARLAAQLEGSAVRLSWLGTLEAGDSWALHNVNRADLEAGAPGTVLYAGTDVEYLHALVGEVHYQVRCEGPGGDGPWSNMAFRLERTLFSSVRQSASGWANHLISLPLIWTPPDVGGGGDDWPCDDAGDGASTLDEALCALWTDVDEVVDGRFTVEVLHREQAAFLARVGSRVAAGAPEAVGSRTPLSEIVGTGAGVNIRVEGDVVDNPVILVGAHDPDFAGYVVTASDGAGRSHLVAVPYHTQYRTATEILCGLEGVDWDDDGSGSPDTCPNGVFDPVSGVSVTVQQLQNDPINGPRFVGRTAFEAGGVRFVGSNFDLVPGEAVVINVAVGYTDRVFLPATF